MHRSVQGSVFDSRALTILLFGIVLIVSVSQHINFLFNSFYTSDDNVYSYLLGNAIFKPQQLASAMSEVSGQLSEKNATEEAIYRFKIREGTLDHYHLYSFWQYVTPRILAGLGGASLEHYHLYMSQGMIVGAFAAHLSILILMLFLLFRFLEIRYLYVLGFTVVLIALLDFVPFPSRLDSIMLHQNVLDSVWHSVYLMIRPNSQYSFFSFPQRANFFWLAFAVLVLRHVKQFSPAYFALLLGAFVHQSLAGLLTAMVIASDVLFRPKIFRDKYILVPALLCFLLFLSRESLWLVVGLQRILFVLGFLLLGVVVAVVLNYYGPKSLGQFLTNVRARLAFLASKFAGIDILFYWSAWIFTWPLVYFFVHQIDDFTTYYFWAGVHGRILGLLVPITLFLFLNSVFQYVWCHRYRDKLLLASGVACVFGCLVIFTRVIHTMQEKKLFARVAIPLVQLNNVAGRVQLEGVDSQNDELLIFFSMSKFLDTGDEAFMKIIAKREN